MFTSFTAKNFRCFRELHVEPLDRVNLIAGKNNTGKSSLLEAIHLHCIPDKASRWVKVNRLRGIDDPLRYFKEVVNWLFNDHDSSRPIELTSKHSDDSTINVKAVLVEQSVSVSTHSNVEESIRKGFRADVASADVPRLILYCNGNPSSAIFWGAGLKADGPRTIWWPTEHHYETQFVASTFRNASRDAKLFGDLDVEKRIDDEIIPRLQILEPRLKTLRLGLFAGEPTIHGDIGEKRLVPLHLMGEGMVRLLSLLLVIASTPGGVICIDEIENGFHYSVLPKVWAAIASAARNADAQVFATTHSYECIAAAHEAFSADQPYDFRLHRLDRTGDDDIRAVTYDRETLGTSTEMNLEVR
jgi:hypothetical protein